MKPSPGRKALKFASVCFVVIAVASGLLGANILHSGFASEVARNAIIGFLAMSAWFSALSV